MLLIGWRLGAALRRGGGHRVGVLVMVSIFAGRCRFLVSGSCRGAFLVAHVVGGAADGWQVVGVGVTMPEGCSVSGSCRGRSSCRGGGLNLGAVLRWLSRLVCGRLWGWSGGGSFVACGASVGLWWGLCCWMVGGGRRNPPAGGGDQLSLASVAALSSMSQPPLSFIWEVAV